MGADDTPKVPMIVDGKVWRIAAPVLSGIILLVISHAVFLWKEVEVIKSNRWTAKDHAEYAAAESRVREVAFREIHETMAEIKMSLARLPESFPPKQYVDTMDKRLDQLQLDIQTMTKEISALTSEVAALRERLPKEKP